MRHLCDAVVRVGKKLLAGVDADLAQIADRRAAAVQGKGVGKIIFIQMRNLRQGIQRDVLYIIRLNVSLDLDAFSVDLGGRGYLEGEIGPADQLDDQHLQKVLADNLTVPVFFFHFTEHGVHAEKQILLFIFAAENDVFLVSLKGKTHALHSDGYIFQRLFAGGDLRMGDSGIDDHEIILLDGVFLFFHQKAPHTVLYIKQFGKGMDVGMAVPVVFISGVGNIKQLILRCICKRMIDGIN